MLLLRRREEALFAKLLLTGTGNLVDSVGIHEHGVAGEECPFEFWVRNPVGKNGGSFFLQTATKKFYPDFVCKLADGRILVVEYKGGDRWNNAGSDRLVGELWEEMSGGTCAFVMVKEKNWEWIQAKFRPLYLQLIHLLKTRRAPAGGKRALHHCCC